MSFYLLIIMDQVGTFSIDFILSVFLFFVIATSILNVITERVETVKETEKLADARNLAEEIARMIDLVYYGGKGHSIKITLPQKVGDNNYKVKVNSSGVYIMVDGMMGKANIIPKKLVNSEPPSYSQITLLPGRSYTICNMEDKNGGNWIVIN